MELKVLTTLDDLDAAIAGSASRPLLLFKHSLTCGTSAHAYEEVEAMVADGALPVNACVIRVQTCRALSNAIADRFGIRHESPQLLLIWNGQVVWHASHYRITRREITTAVERQLASVIADASSVGTP